jgi:recombination protein RecA
VQQNLVEKSGSWYSYKGERIGQGRDTAKQFLRDNPDVFKKIDLEVRKAIGLVRPEVANGAPQTPAAPTVAAPAPAAAARGRG